VTSGIALLALIIVLGGVLILSSIVAEYRYYCRKLQHQPQASDTSDVTKMTIAGGYRYVCWFTGTAMIAAAIVLLFRLEW
jgi:hypothetical protein